MLPDASPRPTLPRAAKKPAMATLPRARNGFHQLEPMMRAPFRRADQPDSKCHVRRPADGRGVPARMNPLKHGANQAGCTWAAHKCAACRWATSHTWPARCRPGPRTGTRSAWPRRPRSSASTRSRVAEHDAGAFGGALPPPLVLPAVAAEHTSTIRLATAVVGRLPGGPAAPGRRTPLWSTCSAWGAWSSATAPCPDAAASRLFGHDHALRHTDCCAAADELWSWLDGPELVPVAPGLRRRLWWVTGSREGAEGAAERGTGLLSGRPGGGLGANVVGRPRLRPGAGGGRPVCRPVVDRPARRAGGRRPGQVARRSGARLGGRSSSPRPEPMELRGSLSSGTSCPCCFNDVVPGARPRLSACTAP